MTTRLRSSISVLKKIVRPLSYMGMVAILFKWPPPLNKLRFARPKEASYELAVIDQKLYENVDGRTTEACLYECTVSSPRSLRKAKWIGACHCLYDYKIHVQSTAYLADSV